ncbi:YjiH family protein [Romboutsia sp.]|uniref:YjiH family protein n=1 Tax=Romboutsia sp. TaxID=1965302 RepID=UPI003F2A84CF
MEDLKKYNPGIMLRSVIYSLIGIIMFFVPIELFGVSTIPLDHMVSVLKNNLPQICTIYAFVMIIIGGILPFIKKTYKKDKVTMVFSILKLCGILIAVMAVFNVGPKILMEPNMIPFLYNKLVIPVGLVVPIGAVFLSFLIGYGLLEFVGVFMQPVMRPIFKTPGKSAVDAVASFVGSYSLALLITNRVYKEGKYSTKDAYIIATGFSTVSASFMVIVAKTLGIMNMWNVYFWSTLVITFMVTAIVVRLGPTSKIKEDDYYNGICVKEEEIHSDRFKHAIHEGMVVAESAPSLFNCIKSNLKDGLMMATGILPSILSVGLIGLLLAEYTPLFDILGYVLYPVTYLLSFLGLENPLLVAKASTLSLAEMFLPAILIGESLNVLTRYVIAVISISSILFFSASIPCMLSTEIPFKVKDFIIIWFQRVVLSLILATIFGSIFIA